MIVQGRTPRQVSFIADPKRWPKISSSHPEIFQTCSALKQLLEEASQIEFESEHPQSLAVYGLGHLCVEDFLEIMVLEEHEYHGGSRKLLRGLFERMITAEVIADDLTEARRFFDYYHVDLRKLVRRSEGVYGPADPLKGTEHEELNKRARDQFRRKKCEHCGNAPPMAWSSKSLETHANEVGKKLTKLYGDNGDRNGYKVLYLAGADLSNPLIHASMMGIYSRLVPGTKENSATFKDSFPDLGSFEQAESWLLTALQTRDRFFKLGLTERLNTLHIALHDAIKLDYECRKAGRPNT